MITAEQIPAAVRAALAAQGTGFILEQHTFTAHTERHNRINLLRDLRDRLMSEEGDKREIVAHIMQAIMAPPPFNDQCVSLGEAEIPEATFLLLIEQYTAEWYPTA